MGFEPIDIEAPEVLLDEGFLRNISSEFGSGVVSGFMNVGGGLIGTAEFLIPGEQEFLTEAKENIEEAMDPWRQKRGGLESMAGRMIGEALPYMGASLIGGGAAGAGAKALGYGAKAVSMATKIGAGMVAFSVEGQNAYDDAIATGASENEANAERFIIGTINAAIEASQIDKLLKFKGTGGASMKSFIRNVRSRMWAAAGGDIKKLSGQILRHSLAEGMEEAAQELTSISVPGVLRGQMPRMEDGGVDWMAALERVAFAGAGGAFAGAVLGGGMSAISSASEIGRPSNKDIDTSIQKIKDSKMDDSEKEFWVSKMEQFRVKNNKEAFDEKLKGVEVPEGVSNVYRGAESGEVYFETADGGETRMEQTEEGGTRIVSTKTGEELIHDKQLSGSGILNQVKKGQAAIRQEWDDGLVEAIKNVDTTMRVAHEAQIKVEKGKRIGRAEEALKIDDENPRVSFHRAKEALSGALGLRFDPIEFNEQQLNYYYMRLKTSRQDLFTKIKAEDGLNALFGLYKDSEGKAKLPEPGEIKALEKIWGRDMADALNKMRGYKSGVMDKIIETLNFPRAVLASFDFSAAGRQGLMLLPAAPKEWASSIRTGYKAWLSPEYADFIQVQIMTHPMYDLYRDAGGHISQPGTLGHGEEVFASKMANKIPGIKASERAYTTTLNSLRFYTFAKFAKNWTGTGKSKSDYQALAKFINHATGRGDLKGLEKYAPFLNATFFAPRLQMGRIQAITDLFRGSATDLKHGRINAARKVIAADLVSFFAGGMGVLWLLSRMKGVKVEKDPRSSDFGKIRFGNTRIDFWAGYSQMARLMARMVTSQTKGTESGRVSDIDRGTTLWRFLQTKLSPGAGMAVDWVRKETFLGESLDFAEKGVLTSQMYQRFVPLFFQDVRDAFEFQGVGAAGIVAPLAMHGIGAMTYSKSAGSEASRLRDVHSMEVFGVAWDQLSGKGQDALREARPEIPMAEKRAKIDRRNFGGVGAGLAAQRKAMDKIVRSMPKGLRREMEGLDVYLPGLSRQVGQGWYLNDKRYKEYQANIATSMNDYLPRLLELPRYNGLPPQAKALMIEKVVQEIRKAELKKIMQSATMNDLKRLKEQ
jgi:hypothetical protein